MDVLLISKPGVHLTRSLRESETAWDAIRFYDPIGLSIGVYIPVSTIAGAISLASDLKFFIRKYTNEHLFLYAPGIFLSAALTRDRYLNRNIEFTSDWPYRLIYWIENQGSIKRYPKSFWDEQGDTSLWDTQETGSSSEHPYPHDPEDMYIGGYLIEVWCTQTEFDVLTHGTQ